MATNPIPTETTTCGHRRSGGDAVCVEPVNHDGDHADGNGRTWHNHGPLQRYEIVWMSGHVETVPAHQVTYPHVGLALFSGGMRGGHDASGPPRVNLHAEIDGQWLLTLSAREEDIRSMRLVTGGEAIPDA